MENNAKFLKLGIQFIRIMKMLEIKLLDAYSNN